MLLLEVLIAMALVALCAFPLIAPQLAIINEQQAFIKEMKRNHYAHLVYAHVIEELYHQRPEWQEIENKTVFPIPKGLLPEGIEGFYVVEVVKEKSDQLGSSPQALPAEWIVDRLKITTSFLENARGEKKDQQKVFQSFPYEVTLVRHLLTNGPRENAIPEEQKGKSEPAEGKKKKKPNKRAVSEGG